MFGCAVVEERRRKMPDTNRQYCTVAMFDRASRVPLCPSSSFASRNKRPSSLKASNLFSPLVSSRHLVGATYDKD